MLVDIEPKSNLGFGAHLMAVGVKRLVDGQTTEFAMTARTSSILISAATLFVISGVGAGQTDVPDNPKPPSLKITTTIEQLHDRAWCIDASKVWAEEVVETDVRSRPGVEQVVGRIDAECRDRYDVAILQ